MFFQPAHLQLRIFRSAVISQTDILWHVQSQLASRVKPYWGRNDSSIQYYFFNKVEKSDGTVGRAFGLLGQCQPTSIAIES